MREPGAPYAEQHSTGNGTSFPSTTADFPSQPDAYTSDGLDFMDPFSYSMEILEAHPFLAYDNFAGAV
jgi:hypothetical protein